MKFRLLPVFLLFLVQLHALGATPAKLLSASEHPPVSGLRVANNYPFPVREKITLRLAPELASQDGNLLAVSHSVVGGTVEAHYLPVQIAREQNEENPIAWIDVQLRPGESRRYTFQNLGNGGKQDAQPELNHHHASGLPHRVSLPSGIAVELFDLSLLEIFADLDGFSANPDNRIRQALPNAISAKFELAEESHGPVLSTFLYRGKFEGENSYRAEIRYHLLSSGVCDIEIALQPVELTRKNGYLALVKTISVPENIHASVRRDGEIEPIETASTPSASGAPESDIRWLALQNETDETARAILADFTPNLTRLHDDRYIPVNGLFVTERAIADKNRWLMLSEISRENPANGNAPDDFILPEKSETISLRFRILPAREQDLQTIDQAFTAFAGYRGRSIVEEDLQVEFGVGAVGFGTAYADRENRQQIKRDFRIANAIGLQWIRIDGIDSLKNLDFLEFAAETAEKTGLKLLLNFSLNPADARVIAERFGHLIELYEIDTAESAPGVSKDQLAEAEKVRKSILAAQPNATVFLKSPPQNISLQKRIADSGFAPNATAQTFPSSLTNDPAKVRDAALALGGFSSVNGKTPLISEYIWTADEQQSEDEQANQFFHSHQNLLEQRGASTLFISRFSDTAERPGTAPIRLDGTPKPQAQALYELIQRHSSADHRNKQVEVKMPLLRISPDRTITLPVTITNKGNQPLEIRTRPLLPDGLTTDSAEETFTLRPRQSRTIERAISAGSDLAPGVHHIFEEIRFNDTVRLGWTYARYKQN